MSKVRTVLVCGLLICIFLSPPAFSEPPKNVFLFIGDGMGFEHVKAAGLYVNGATGGLSFETFPHRGEVRTYSASDRIADSAAAATAMATGRKVDNGVVSVAIPGDGSELLTLLEYFKARGRSTGLVTTTYITHATPACFGAHEPTRDNLEEIAEDYLTQTKPNVLFGAGGHGISPQAAAEAGYVVVTDTEGLQQLKTQRVNMVSGQFGWDIPYEYNFGISGGRLPHLSEMAAVALDILGKSKQGFFLMVEGGKIDWAAHENDSARNIFETIEFAKTVQQAFDWAEGRSDTLIVVTADHETGGLKVVESKGKGNLPTVTFSTDEHTAANVPIYAWGVNAELVSGVLDNTDIFAITTIDMVSDFATKSRNVVPVSFRPRCEAVPAKLILLLSAVFVLMVLVKVVAIKSATERPLE